MPWSGGTYTKGNNATGGWTGDQSLGIGIEAGRHDTQDNDFATGINQCLNKDGSNSATGNLNLGGFKVTNVANGTASGDVVNFSQLLSIIPAGVISAYGAAAAPSGWLLCNGNAISRTAYATLFAIIGTTYGVGDGSTTFNLPNLQQRFPLGKATSGTGATLGGTGGSIDHNHTSAAHTHTIASHTHTVASHTHTVSSHSHTLSDSGAAKITYTSTDTLAGRVNTANWTWTGTTAPDVPWASSSGTSATGAGLIGSTDGTALTTDGTALTTNGTSLTTDSTTPGVTGNNNPPFLVVNYIIKT